MQEFRTGHVRQCVYYAHGRTRAHTLSEAGVWPSGT